MRRVIIALLLMAVIAAAYTMNQGKPRPITMEPCFNPVGKYYTR